MKKNEVTDIFKTVGRSIKNQADESRNAILQKTLHERINQM